MADTQNSRILLESGTNEIEIMKFTIAGNLYGINVAKVQEIIMSDKVKPRPHSHPAVEGSFKPRETLITVINLPFYLTGQTVENAPRDLFIVTNFNKMTVAFRVQSIEGISRISWKDIQKPDKTLNNGDEGVATGIAQCDDQLVTILDFEKIVDYSVDHMSVVERGVKAPKLDKLVTIANVLKVGTDELLQDNLDVATLLHATELSERLKTLSPEGQRKVMNVLDTLVDELR